MAVEQKLHVDVCNCCPDIWVWLWESRSAIDGRSTAAALRRCWVHNVALCSTAKNW